MNFSVLPYGVCVQQFLTIRPNNVFFDPNIFNLQSINSEKRHFIFRYLSLRKFQFFLLLLEVPILCGCWAITLVHIYFIHCRSE